MVLVWAESYRIMVCIMSPIKSDNVKWFNVFLQLKSYVLFYCVHKVPLKPVCPFFSMGKLFSMSYETPIKAMHSFNLLAA